MSRSKGGINPDELQVGVRVSLLTNPASEALGFVTAIDEDSLTIIDRRGVEHVIGFASIVGGRRVGVALGRDPLKTPRSLLDGLAERAGASGEPWVCRISALLADRTPPAAVPEWGEWASLTGARARFEGEWVTLADGTATDWVDAAWWATRMGARSVQVRTSDPEVADALTEAGFQRLD